MKRMIGKNDWKEGLERVNEKIDLIGKNDWKEGSERMIGKKD